MVYQLKISVFAFFLRYASLYFCLGVENDENELLALEVIHRYVELLDKYFGNVFLFILPFFLQAITQAYSMSPESLFIL